MKKLYGCILLISIILNIFLALAVNNLYTKNNKNIKSINYCKKYLKELEYKEHINYNTTTKQPIITKYYEITSFNELDYQKAKKCYDNLNIKIKNN